ncbi:MAG: hypothetical protein M1444_02625 [Patescibacteria group bacterium]|nr:hypothetical protein [Patescibacteria group bacterium]
MPERPMIERRPHIGLETPYQSRSGESLSPKVKLGKRRSLASRYPTNIIGRIAQGAHGLVEQLPDSVDKKTLNKAVDIETGFVKDHLQGVITKKTKVPGTDIDRGVAVRFEREEIHRVYRLLKQQVEFAKQRGEDGAGEKAMLAAFRIKARVLEKNLDKVYRQFYGNRISVKINNPELGIDEISVAVLDLNPPKEGEEDTRTPYVLIPTYASSPVQTAEFSMQLALKGERVMVWTFPEKYLLSKPADNWLDKLQKNGTLEPYARAVEKTIQKLREDKIPKDKRITADRINLVGLSMGAAIALEIAADSNFSGQIQDLIVVEPPSVFKRTQAELLAAYGLRESSRALVNAEERIKVAVGENARENVATLVKTPFVVTPILARELITMEKLQRIRPHGRFQVWFGGHSSVTGKKTREAFLEAESDRKKDPNASPLEMYVIKGGRHQSPIVHSGGVTAVITAKERPSQTVTTLAQEDLDNSAAASILNNLAA